MLRRLALVSCATGINKRGDAYATPNGGAAEKSDESLHHPLCYERRRAKVACAIQSPGHTSNTQGATMDLEELRLSCLRMAYELGGKTEAIISAANELMSFVTEGPTPASPASAPEPAITEEAPCKVSALAAEPAVADRIAACGTAMEMPESGDLAQAEPAVEVMAAAEPEPAAAVEAEAVPSEAAAEDAATITEPTPEVAAAGAASASPEPVKPPAEPTNGELAGPVAAPEVEAAAVAPEPVANASEASSHPEGQTAAAAPITDGAGQEHTAN